MAEQGKKVHFDWNEIDSYLQAGCDGVQVAAALGICPDTLYNRTKEEKGLGFSDYRAKQKSAGIGKIFNKQYEKALTGDNTMLIWLGKVYGGQTEDHVVTLRKAENISEITQKDSE